MADDVYKRYNEFGTDHIIMLVHSDNWIFKGIWGSNWSNIFHSYHFGLCRWDKKNMANSFGTLYHEVMHSLDALIKTTTGIEIDHLFNQTRCFFDWDATVVHGNRFRDCKETPYKYIRWKDNIDALAMIAPHLRNSYRKRQELHDKHIGMYNTVISLAQKVIILFKASVNKKDGVPRGK